MTRRIDPKGGLFQAALSGAKLVGGGSPHLRTVDSGATGDAWQTPEDIPETALGLVELTREAASQGVILSMENSGQPLSSMAMLVNEVRSRLTPEEGQYLGLCPDPTNQLRRFPETDPVADLDGLPLDMIKIVHFKQARGGDAHPNGGHRRPGLRRNARRAGCEGIHRTGHHGIPPHQDVFENLSASYKFLWPDE